MDFDELQKNWRSQPVAKQEDMQTDKEQLESHWKKQQRGVLRSNIGVTISFAFVFVVFAWVYTSFHEGRSIFFTGSIVFISVLMLVYLWILWKGIANKRNDPTVSSKDYIDHSIKKLYWRRKTITTYAWIYSILLWLALMFYLLDVTSTGSMQFKVGAIAVTTIYIFGARIIIMKTKEKRQLKTLDELIAEMQLLKKKMEE